MSSSSPIPVPFARRWREFRFRTLPALVFLSSVVTVALLWTSQIPTASLPGQVEADTAEGSSPKAGMLAGLHRLGFHVVSKDDPIRIPSNLELLLGQIVDLKIAPAPPETTLAAKAAEAAKARPSKRTLSVALNDGDLNDQGTRE